MHSIETPVWYSTTTACSTLLHIICIFVWNIHMQMSTVLCEYWILSLKCTYVSNKKTKEKENKSNKEENNKQNKKYTTKHWEKKTDENAIANENAREENTNESQY